MYQPRRTLLQSATARADTARVATRKPANALVLGGGAVVLPLWPGRTFVAQVLRTGNGGAVVALAGCELGVRLAGGATVSPGQRVTLEAIDGSDGTVVLRLV
jgi:hypothetical protein